MGPFGFMLLLLAQSQVYRQAVDLAPYAEVDLTVRLAAVNFQVLPGEGTVLTLHQSPPADPDDSLLIYLHPTETGIEVEIRPKKGARESHGDWEKVFRYLKEQPDSTLRVTLILPREIPFQAVTLDAGVALGTLDFGGLHLKSLEINVGAGEAILDFSEPLAEEAENLEVNVGVGDLHARRLGNGRFRYAEVNTGMATAALDLTGPWPPGARLEASAGIASVCFHIPTNLGVRVETEGFLIVRDFDPLVRENHTWVTPNYHEVPNHLLLSLGGALTHYQVTYGNQETCDEDDD